MTPDEILDDAERELSRVMDRAMREFLAKVRDRADSRNQLTASGNLLALGTLYGWWADLIDAKVMGTILSVYSRARLRRGGTHTSLDASSVWITAVRDRLVLGLVPPLPDDAFNKVRVALAEGAEEGWDPDRLSRRIGATLSWSPKSDYWRGEVERLNGQIAAHLDPLGPPGTPAREWARLNDPKVDSLQKLRTEAVKEAERDESHWKVRADLIARTESTGAANFGMLSALYDEGWENKRWVSAPDARPEHLAANGQTVPLASPFIVGGVAMQAPGDPNAPARLVANCRCSLVGVD